MLKELKIQNLAIAKQVSIQFQTGLNIITGETGAGKSILVDALVLLRGARAGTSMVRTGTSGAQVIGVFTVKRDSHLAAQLEELGCPFEEETEELELVVRRQLTTKGKNRCFFNDTPISRKTLSEFMASLLDVSSQFETQSFSNPGQHTQSLDSFLQIPSLVKAYSEHFHASRKTDSKLKKLIAERELRKREKALYAFELQEIDELTPREEELIELQKTLAIGSRSENARRICFEAHKILSENEGSLQEQLLVIQSHSQKLWDMAEGSEIPLNQSTVDGAIAHVEELITEFQKTAELFEIDVEQYQIAQERHDSYQKILSRFGPDIENVLEHREKCLSYLSESDNLDQKIQDLTAQLDSEIHLCLDIAQKISEKRQAGKKRLEKVVIHELSDLGMPQCQFICQLNPTTQPPLSEEGALDSPPKLKLYSQWRQLGLQGAEEALFLFSANPGHHPEELQKVASGGEMSRVMLAIKGVLFEKEPLSVFIFDEIDSGISGRIAAKVGKKLSEFCAQRQALCVTHLPQVASYGKSHFYVSKEVKQGITESRVTTLSPKERVEELAKMLSGEKLTAESYAQSKALLIQSGAVHQETL